MKKEDFESKMSNMLEKIGTDSSNLILDDVGLLLTDNEEMNKTISNKDREIEELKKKNETLTRVNGNLLQQVSVGKDTTSSFLAPDKKDEVVNRSKPTFDMRDVFDKNGNFKN